MNSVEPPPTSNTRYGAGSSSPAVAPVNVSCAFLLAGDQLRSHADRGLGGGEEVVAVASRRATRSSRSCARARAPSASIRLRYSRSAATVRSIASGWSWRGALTPWPRRVIRVWRSTVASGPLGAAVDVGDEQAGRVGADVDRRRRASACGLHARRVGPRPNARPDRRRPRGGRRSARAGTSRRCASRRRRRTGRGPAWSPASAASRSRGVARVRGAAARRDRPRASAARTPPADFEARDAHAELAVDQPVAGRHRACRRRGAARCGSRPAGRSRRGRRPRTRRAARARAAR